MSYFARWRSEEQKTKTSSYTCARSNNSTDHSDFNHLPKPLNPPWGWPIPRSPLTCLSTQDSTLLRGTRRTLLTVPLLSLNVSGATARCLLHPDINTVACGVWTSNHCISPSRNKGNPTSRSYRARVFSKGYISLDFVALENLNIVSHPTWRHQRTRSIVL